MYNTPWAIEDTFVHTWWLKCMFSNFSCTTNSSMFLFRYPLIFLGKFRKLSNVYSFPISWHWEDYTFNYIFSLYPARNMFDVVLVFLLLTWNIFHSDSSFLVIKIRALVKKIIFILYWPSDWAVLWVLICTIHLTLYFLSCHVRGSEWIHTLQLPGFQGNPCSKQARNLKFKWLQRDSNSQPLSS